MTRPRRLAIVAILGLPLLVTAWSLRSRAEQRSAQLLDQVLTAVALRYVDTVSADSLYASAARGLVRELGDPYTELLTPKDRAAFMRNTGGRYFGVGMLLTPPIDGYVMVDKVYPNTPAASRGVREGDRIRAVDGESVRGWTVDRVQAKLLGERGTPVRVEFGRTGADSPLNLAFTRAEIRVSAVPFSMMLAGQVGYVPVTTFSERTAADVAAAVTALEAQGATGLVLDLRGNPGGIVDEAFALANIFLPAGKVLLTVREREGQEEMKSVREPLAPRLPMIVMIDGGSASSAEIVAGALQDYDRALLLGTTSYGKGLVQSVYNLDGGYALKLTTGKWFTPSGRSIQKPRRYDDAGRWVEVAEAPETDSARRARPTYRSSGGRTLYGGGAITPDVILPPDTISTSEQRVRRALAPHFATLYAALSDVAEAQRDRVPLDFTVAPAWREQVFARLQRDSVRIDRTLLEAGAAEIDRALEERVAKVAFGDSTALRHALKYDTQLQRAQALLQSRRTQAELFTAAGVAPAAVKRGTT
jgi:carboxyl-terminal processing protease